MLPQDFLQLLTDGVGIDRQTAQRKVRIHARRRGDALRGPVRTKAAHTRGGMPSVMATRLATAAEGSAEFGSIMSATETAGTSMRRSMRSRNGPEIRP